MDYEIIQNIQDLKFEFKEVRETVLKKIEDNRQHGGYSDLLNTELETINLMIGMLEKNERNALKKYQLYREEVNNKIEKRNRFILRCLIIGPIMFSLFFICNYFDNEYAKGLFFTFCWAWTTIDLMSRC